MKDWTRLKFDAKLKVVLSGLQFTVSRVICALLNRRHKRGENFICDKHSQNYRVTLNRGEILCEIAYLFLAYIFHRHNEYPTKSFLMPLVYFKEFLSKKNWTMVDPTNEDIFRQQVEGFPKVSYKEMHKDRL